MLQSPHKNLHFTSLHFTSLHSFFKHFIAHLNSLHLNLTWTFWKVHQKYLERFEMWRWRRMVISCTERARNRVELLKVKEKRNILHKIKIRKANYISHILCRKFFQYHVIEGKMDGNRIEITNKMRPCSRIYYSNVS